MLILCGLISPVLNGQSERIDDWAIGDAIRRGDGGFYVTSQLKNEVLYYSPDDELMARGSLVSSPNDMVLSPGGDFIVVTAGQGKGWLYLLDPQTLASRSVLESGHSPQAPAFSPDGKLLALAQRFLDQVWIYDTADWQVTAKYSVLREPIDLVWRNQEELVVLHHLSNRPATAEWTGVSIAKLHVASGELVEIPLEDGSSGARRLALTPEGRYALAPMVIGSHRVPATQIELGWINKNGLCVVDLEENALLWTLLLDEITLVAANPCDIVLGADLAWISLAGTHEIMSVDYPALIERLKNTPPEKREQLTYNLRLGYAWKKRTPLQGLGPRALSISKDGTRLLVASYFNNSVEEVSLEDRRIRIRLGPQKVSDHRRGEFLFNNAKISFQSWMSCSSCHPDARTDALNWDLENDGLGTPRQAKTMLFSHYTPPTTVTGIRPNAETSVRAGIAFLRGVLSDEDARAIDTYLKQLQPVLSPYLKEGRLSQQAIAGKALYHDKAGCTDCHNGEFQTNQELRRVGTGLGKEAGMRYDVPSLNEVWRTAPYLHDGRAATIEEVFTTHNPSLRHGDVDLLTTEELEQLIAYVKSL